MTTNVPSLTFTPTGVIIPTEASILAGVQSDQNAAFGATLNPALNTPQGQLASSLSAIVGDANDNFAYIVNQVDPANSSGAFQDAIGRIYFMTRIAAEPTVVQCVCIGLPGTIIPANALVADTSQNQYICTGGGTIPSTGSITLQFENVSTGAIACAANTVTSIVQQVSGWNTVNNPSAGVVGNAVETQQAFEYRREQSVALNAHGSPAAIYGNVFSVPNIIDCYVIDNPTNAAVLTGSTNYSVGANSVYVAAVGGIAQNIGQAIWNAKDLGCSMNGNTTVVVQDTSGYNVPYPSYNITFNIPTNTNIYVAVQLKNNTNLPSNITTLVQNAIIAAFNGTDGGSRARIGSSLYASRYYSGVAAISPYVAILSILIGETSTPTSNLITMGIDQMPIISAANISVTLV
jgi:hypothetical protein